MRMIPLLFSFVICLGFAPQRASADQVVLELFTSQGCYSCPPADALLAELADAPGVIALAFHVDYWDHLGWKDTFGKPAHSKRQRAYLGHTDRQWITGYTLRGPFTPEMVINGHDSMVGSNQSVIGKRIRTLQAIPRPVDVAVRGNAVEVSLRDGAPAQPKAAVVLISYRPTAEVAILRGENAGKTMRYHNIVTAMERIGTWPGTGAAQFKINAPEGGRHAVLVQVERQGDILGAARLD